MEKAPRSKTDSVRSGPERAQLVGLLINAVAFLASGVSVLTMLRSFVLGDALAALYVVVGAFSLLTIFTALLRREPSNVTKLRERLISSYIEAIGSSPLAPTHSREHGSA